VRSRRPLPRRVLAALAVLLSTLPALAGDLALADDASAAPSQVALLGASLLAAAALVLAGLLAWRSARRLERSLGELGTVAARLGSGDLTARASLSGDRALAPLAAALNGIAQTLQQRLAESAGTQDGAARASAARSRFFAAASHDLRQPMHALSLLVAALKARNREAEVDHLVGHIEDATAAMEVLFNDLLDISRLDAGAVEIRPRHFSLQRLFDELGDRFAPLAAEKGLLFRVRPAAAFVLSDPLLLERIVANLVSNAIRHTDDGGVLLACRRRGAVLRIEVWDSGRGIPPDQQQAVFEEFVQLHNPERDRSRGLGLGLAIVARLAGLLRHPLTLRSQAGRGSLFAVEVPAGDPGRAAPAAPQAAPQGLPEDTLVVLVDDEAAILHGMAELFDCWAIDLVTARNADDALEWLAAIGRTPDVIIADYRLASGLDGVEVVSRLRRHFRRAIPAVVISGDTTPHTLESLGQAGLPVLHKPLRPARLRALLGHLVQQNRAAAVG